MRNDESYSSLYAIHEDKFLKISNGDGNGEAKVKFYNMPSMDKNLLDNFMFVRNNMLLFAKTNVDMKTGKCTLVDPLTNRSIPIGDGIIPQVEKQADKYVYNRLSTEVFRTVVNAMAEKAKNPTGNKFMFICNIKGWQQVQAAMDQFLVDHKVEGEHMWSKEANGYIKVGATFNTYEFAGKCVAA